MILVLGLLWFLRRWRQRATENHDTVQSPITAFIISGRRGLSNWKSAIGEASMTALGDEKLTQRRSLVSPFSSDSPSEMGKDVVTLIAQHTGVSFHVVRD